MLFDIDRAYIRDKAFCEPHTVTMTLTLSEALTLEHIVPDTEVMIIELDDEVYALNIVHLIYHHVVHGKTEKQPWMLSYCVICNAGVVFSPIIEGKHHHFAERGLYNAMTILSDSETGSLWQHLSGECLHGEHKGKHLEILATPQPMLAKVAEKRYPQAKYVFTALTPNQQELADDNYTWGKKPEFSENLEGTMTTEDKRLNRYTMGLGVWLSDEKSIFFPYQDVNAANNALITSVGPYKLLIFIDPHTGFPRALGTPADSVTWDADTLKLDDGTRLTHGVLYDAEGQPMRPTQPRQLMMRWYGFAYTFPNCTIYRTDK